MSNDDVLPDWLARDYAPPHFDAWNEDIAAFTVLPRQHPRTGQLLPPQSECEDWPLGIVTADGRWILRPQEGAILAHAVGGHLHVQFPEEEAGAGRPSGLMDLQGQWLIPPSAGYKDLLSITPHVVQVKSSTAGEGNELRSFPGMELLHTRIIDASWWPGDETLRADRGQDFREQALVMDAHGKPLFDSPFDAPYERVNEFDPKTGLSVVAIRVPFVESDGSPSSRALEGVIHISGAVIIPCEYELIERSFLSSPPRVHPGGKLLAFTPQLQPRVYSSDGKLLSAPDLYASRSQLKLKKGELLTLMGQGPEAETAMFSLKDFSITPMGQTWREYLQSKR